MLGGLALTGYEVYKVITEDANYALHILLLVVGILLCIASFLFLFIKIHKDKVRCPKCGQSLKGCAYEWQLVRLYDTLENQMAQYEVKATCSQCGNEKIYNKDFIVSSVRSGAVANPQKLIEDWCKQMFGH